MSVTVRIPTPLRKLTKEADVVSGDGGTLASCIESLERQYPGPKERLCDEVGELRRFGNVYVNGEGARCRFSTHSTRLPPLYQQNRRAHNLTFFTSYGYRGRDESEAQACAHRRPARRGRGVGARPRAGGVPPGDGAGGD